MLVTQKYESSHTYLIHLGALTVKGLVTISQDVLETKSVPDVVSQIMAQTRVLLYHTALIVMVTTLLMQRHALSG